MSAAVAAAAILASYCAAQEPQDTAPNTGRVVTYAPGIRIDWPKRRIELDAVVNMRSGPIELFACSPKTKEHESVVVVGCRPRHVYEALHLLGLDSGAPARFDLENDRAYPAHGAALSVEVRYDTDTKTSTVPIHRWMRRRENEKSTSPGRWVFAGSVRWVGDRLAADVEGTVICVVDFDTALIALGESHSADNNQLWLEANPDVVPAKGTKCTILLSAAKPTKNDAKKQTAAQPAPKPPAPDKQPDADPDPN